MKKLLLILLFLCLLPMAALADEIAFAPDVTAQYLWPEDADEASALYLYRCRYPQLAGESTTAELINNTYQYLLTDALGFECPMNATSLPLDGPQMRVDIRYEVTHQSADFLSILLIKELTYGEEMSTILSAHTFALTGNSAGIATSLPYLLGILDADETDEWYLDRQIEKADACARELVWGMLEDGDVPLYEDMTYEEFEWTFYPEEDFYLDENGNPVFFLQEGLVAPPEYGALLCPITLETLLDEI